MADPKLLSDDELRVIVSLSRNTEADTPERSRTLLRWLPDLFEHIAAQSLSLECRAVEVEQLTERIAAQAAEIVRIRTEKERVAKLLEEFTDVAICSIEGAAQDLRKIVGYPIAPYPPIEREPIGSEAGDE